MKKRLIELLPFIRKHKTIVIKEGMHNELLDCPKCGAILNETIEELSDYEYQEGVLQKDYGCSNCGFMWTMEYDYMFNTIAGNIIDNKGNRLGVPSFLYMLGKRAMQEEDRWTKGIEIAVQEGY